MGVHRFVAATPPEAAVQCSHHLVARLDEALSGQPFATLAISGGSSPRPVFEALASSALDWERIHLFWVDERMVPPNDPQSNYGMALRLLIEPSGIPHRNVHRVRGELRPDDAARNFSEEIRTVFGIAEGELPHFDAIHCGVGADGHTASLFPGDPAIEDRETIAAAVFVEKMAQWRVTLLPGVLLAARHTVVFATGGDKAEVIRDIFEGSYDPGRLPAQLIAHHGRSVAWFMDQAAVSAAGR
jgi:6-phosphogluconolactonase